MTTSRSQRIHRGFHRVGTTLAVIMLVLGIVGLIVVALEEPNKPMQMLVPIVGAAAAALAVYLVSRALGWIIAGFVGD